MQKGLDSSQLENDGLNCSNLNEEGPKMQKKKYEDKCHKTLFRMSKEERNVYFI